MKISEITADYLIDYCTAYNDEATKRDMEIILAASKSYIKSYTGLDDSTMDSYEDLTLILLAIASDSYDNRSFSVETSKVNQLYQSILDMHCTNLL